MMSGQRYSPTWNTHNSSNEIIINIIKEYDVTDYLPTMNGRNRFRQKINLSLFDYPVVSVFGRYTILVTDLHSPGHIKPS